MTSSRAQVARRLHPMARGAAAPSDGAGAAAAGGGRRSLKALVDVASTGEFVAERMAQRREDADARGRDMCPSFVGAELALDLAYHLCSF